ncbi:phage tail protein [Streptomyces uncialis]|uniref:phage tail protein n=1 Tax=Streptomyces uncialis TaxID=1048205 RepID=UPI00366925DC
MSFLVASGHVQVDARTGSAKDDIDDLIRKLQGLDPAAGSASEALKDLGQRARTSGRALGSLAEKADDAEDALKRLKAAARDVRITADLDDQISSNTGAIRTAVSDLQALGPITIAADLDDRTAATAAGIEAVVASLDALGPVEIPVSLDDRTAAAFAAVTAAVTGLDALDPVRIPVTLDDQLSGASATVEAAVAALDALGPITITADLDDQVTGHTAAIHTAVAGLQALSQVDIVVTVDPNTAAIISAAAAVSDLRSDARDAGTALTRLATKATAAAASLVALRQAADEASEALRELRARAAAAAAATQELRDSASRASSALRTLATRTESADGRLEALTTRMRSTREETEALDAAFRQAGSGLGTLSGSIASYNQGSARASGNTRAWLKWALLLSPALIPIAAQLAPIAAGTLGASAGLLAFGVAVGSVIKQVSDASEAQGEYDKAVREHGRYSTEAAEAQSAYADTMRRMPAPVRQAAAAFAEFKEEYKSWSNSLAGDTAPVVTHSFAMLETLLPRLTPLVRGMSGELDRTIAVITGSFDTPGFDRAMDRFADFSSGALARARLGIIEFADELDSDEVGEDYREFMAYVRESGPAVSGALSSIAGSIVHILVAASDMGLALLPAFEALGDLVSAVPTEVLSVLLQLYAGMQLVSLGAAGMNAVMGGGAAARLAAYFAVMRAAGVAPTLRATAGSMTMVQKAGLGLGVLGAAVLIIDQLAQKSRGAPPDINKLAESLKQLSLTGNFSGELKKTFTDMDGFVASARKVRAEGKFLEDMEPLSSLSGFGPLIEPAVRKLDDLARGAKSVGATEDDLKAFDESFASLARGGNAGIAAEEFRKFEAALKGAGMSTAEINKLFPEYQSAVTAVKGEQELAARGMGIFGQQAMETKSKLDQQKQSTDGLRQSLVALNDVNRAGLGGMIGFEAAIDAATKAAGAGKNVLSMNRGELNLNSEAARAAATVLQDLATKTDGAATSARESGASWETVNGIYSRGRSELVAAANQLGLTGAEAERFADSILKIPDKHSTKVEMDREDALQGLDDVIAKIKKTPSGKSVTVKTLSTAAIKALEAVGFKVKHLPDGSLTVTAETGTARSNLAAVQGARDNLSGKTIVITTVRRTVLDVVQGGIADSANAIRQQAAAARARAQNRWRGGRVAGHAAGGEVQAFPEGGYIDGPGTPTSDSVLAMMGSGAVAKVSDTEYVVRAAAVAKYGVGFLDSVNAMRWVPGFAKGGTTKKKKKLTPKQQEEERKRKEAARKAEEARKEALRRQNESRGQLREDVTVGNMARIAGRTNPEIRGRLGRPGSESDLVSSLYDLQKKIKGSFKGATESRLLGQLTKSADSLFRLRDASEANAKSLDKARDKLSGLRESFAQLRDSIKSSLRSFGNITKIGKWGTSTETILQQLRSDTGRTTEFAGMLEQLRAKGLNAQSLQEIAQAGVAGGGMATAQSLLNATPAQIKEINALEKQLTASAERAGKTTADAMYGAGIKAAEGIVAGLAAKQKLIEAQMMRIAKAMEAAIKKALGIRSPAQRLMPVGDMAWAGVEEGWTKRMRRGTTLLSGNAARFRPTVPQPALAAVGAPTATQAAPTVILNPTFNTMTLPAPGERKQFARAMAADINDALLDYQKERRR